MEPEAMAIFFLASVLVGALVVVMGLVSFGCGREEEAETRTEAKAGGIVDIVEAGDYGVVETRGSLILLGKGVSTEGNGAVVMMCEERISELERREGGQQ